MNGADRFGVYVFFFMLLGPVVLLIAPQLLRKLFNPHNARIKNPAFFYSGRFLVAVRVFALFLLLLMVGCQYMCNNNIGGSGGRYGNHD